MIILLFRIFGLYMIALGVNHSYGLVYENPHLSEMQLILAFWDRLIMIALMYFVGALACTVREIKS